MRCLGFVRKKNTEAPGSFALPHFGAEMILGFPIWHKHQVLLSRSASPTRVARPEVDRFPRTLSFWRFPARRSVHQF
jgi:hypothetical protein